MPKRPCATCATPTENTYCPAHTRDRNLAGKVLPTLLQHSHTCVLCGLPITEPRGKTSGAPSVQHLDGDPSNNTPSNLALAHYGCNSSAAGL